jgi:hypothetical protein
MSKTLQEIQEFNRKKIIGSVNGTVNFDRVLIAIRQRGYYDDIWFGENDDCFLEFDIKNLSWDLTKRTLEKQSKKTQKAIYEFLGGENE